jgi:hypothetical protein
MEESDAGACLTLRDPGPGACPCPGTQRIAAEAARPAGDALHDHAADQQNVSLAAVGQGKASRGETVLLRGGRGRWRLLHGPLQVDVCTSGRKTAVRQRRSRARHSGAILARARSRRPSRQPSLNRADDMLRALSGKSAAAAGEGLILAADRRSPRTVNVPLTAPMHDGMPPCCPNVGGRRGSRRDVNQPRDPGG